MSNPYTDRMDAIARLRVQRAAIENQIADEVAKAWRLSPANNLAVFAQNLGMTLEEARLLLESKGIFVRTQVTE